jgi:2-polyprenyl-3-methyl-5-hydroxy-6-metoxy-1,4-benzoquinol methylase
MKKLVVCIMGQDCIDWLDLAVASVAKYADAIVFIDGADEEKCFHRGSKERIMLQEKYQFHEGLPYPEGELNRIYLNMPFRHDYIGSNGYQRNIYLEYVKRYFPDYWCLVLDADEVVDNAKKLKDDIQEIPEGIYSIKMRHLINDFMHEDATVENHFVPNRLFKIRDDFFYPETEHCVLQGKKDVLGGKYANICIWHLAYVKHKFELLKKYKNHLSKSEVHSKNFLNIWYLKHLLGTYENKVIDTNDLPVVLQRKFEIEHISEQIYFQRRANLETKHFIDAMHIRDCFHPKRVMDVGCGLGLRQFAMDAMGIDTYGIEISRYAINMNPSDKLRNKIICIDISLPDLTIGEQSFDFVLCYDVLEHMQNEDALDRALINIKKFASDKVLCSIPTIGDPNLELDSTHHIKATKDWWKSKFKEHGYKELKVPEHFLYREQLFLWTTK